MFKLWGKIVKKNNLVQSHVLEMNQEDQSIEEMLSKGIEDLCNHFDIANPMWMRDNTLEMDQMNKTRFRVKHFIEEFCQINF